LLTLLTSSALVFGPLFRFSDPLYYIVLSFSFDLSLIFAYLTSYYPFDSVYLLLTFISDAITQHELQHVFEQQYDLLGIFGVFNGLILFNLISLLAFN